jgi:hypothetical protein
VSECSSVTASFLPSFPLHFTSLDSRHRPEHDLSAPNTNITLLNLTLDLHLQHIGTPSARISRAITCDISWEHRRCICSWSLLCLALGCSLLTLAAHLALANKSASPDSYTHPLTRSQAHACIVAAAGSPHTFWRNLRSASEATQSSSRHLHRLHRRKG